MTGNPECFVYLLGPLDGPQKIGSSMDPRHRLNMMQSEKRCRLYMFGQWPVAINIAQSVERYAHWLLRDRIFHGEWFNVTRAEAEQAIATAISRIDQLDGKHVMPPVDRGNSPYFPERLIIRLSFGTTERIDTLAGTNSRSRFIREAVENELARRETDQPQCNVQGTK